MSDIFRLSQKSGVPLMEPSRTGARSGGGGQLDISKLDLDELYTNNRELYEKKRALYERELRIVHKTIQESAKETPNKYCWYQIPNMVMGVPVYDEAECTGFIFTELLENGFKVRYVHPGWLFIVWAHWVPSYLRQEIKMRHGITINSLGEIVPPENEDGEQYEDNPTSDTIQNNPHHAPFMQPGGNTGMTSRHQSRKFKPVESYKPRGVYNDELLYKLEEKMQKGTPGKPR
jgi:hypothetical protein